MTRTKSARGMDLMVQGERVSARDAVEGVLIEGGEAEDIAGAGDAEEEEPAIAGRGGDFDAAGAEIVEVVGG